MREQVSVPWEYTPDDIVEKYDLADGMFGMHRPMTDIHAYTYFMQPHIVLMLMQANRINATVEEIVECRFFLSWPSER